MARNSKQAGGALYGSWGKLERLERNGGLGALAERFFGRANLQAAGMIQKAMRQHIDGASALYAPLHPFTIERKGHDRPLIDTGTLRDAIVVERAGRGKVFIGFKPGVPHPGSDLDVATIAQILNDGATIEVTERMRRYLAAQGLYLRAETTTLIIPPRPFMDDTIREVSGAIGLLYRGVVDELHGALR